MIVLLVMDNFEHLLQGTGLLVDILHTAPGVKLLSTSRERLKLSDEVVFTLSGMRFPDFADGLLPDTDLTDLRFGGAFDHKHPQGQTQILNCSEKTTSTSHEFVT